DEAQWMDEASLDLLAYLVRRLDQAAMLLLLTWRTEDVPPGHRLRQLLAGAKRAGQAEGLALTRLDRAAVAQLVAEALPESGRPAGEKDLAARLYRETEGLPFF